MSIYIRLFTNPDTSIKLSERKIPIGYFPWEMRVGLQKSKIPENNFIISPIYKHRFTDDISDAQPGITGHVEKNENSIDAFSREAGEEIGLIPNIQLEPVYTSKKFKIYSVNIKDCRPVTQDEINKHSEYIPITLQKIGGFIHGDFESIQTFIKSEIYRYNSTDTDIIGLSMISRSDIEKFLHIN
jgi:hypothetical protein